MIPDYIIILLSGAIGLILGGLLTGMYYAVKLKQLNATLDQTRHTLETQHTDLLNVSREHAAALEKIRMLEDIRTSMTDTFKAISANMLRDNNQAFMDLAGTTLSAYMDKAKLDLDARGKTISSIVTPIKESLDRYDRSVTAMEREREKAYGSLTQQVHALLLSQDNLQKETGKLAKALQVPHVRGRWGEITLKRVAELSGMLNHCDFTEQTSNIKDNTIQRPDMVVHLPGNRKIVVDAKVPLTAYLESLEAETPAEQQEKLMAHARQVLSHIQALAKKSYWAGFQPAPEFVILFIPGENFFSAAVTQIPSLIDEGVKKGVILATPTTLISLLKSVAFGWHQEKAAENAIVIRELGKELFDRLANMANHLNTLGRDLNRSTATYNRLIGSFERRVFATARKFKDLGISSKQGENLPDINKIEGKAKMAEEPDITTDKE